MNISILIDLEIVVRGKTILHLSDNFASIFVLRKNIFVFKQQLLEMPVDLHVFVRT